MIAIFGAGGQVGRALAGLLPDAAAFDVGDVDFLHPKEVLLLLEGLRPDVVFNAAAYTQVERAEGEEGIARAINAATPAEVASWCAGHGAEFIHFSTDYVFGGDGTRPWTEDDPMNPWNAYGRTKAEGDRRVAAAGGRFLIFRTSWLYDDRGRNFLTTMMSLARERETIRVVDDQFGAPTYAPELAAAVVEAHARARAAREFPSGVYHLCHAGETSWFGFARAIFEAALQKGAIGAVPRLEAISTKEYGGPVRRPRNSRLATEKARRVLGVGLPRWEEGLRACMERIR